MSTGSQTPKATSVASTASETPKALNYPEPTAGDMRLFCAIIKHTKNPEIDWEAVVNDTEYKNISTAVTRFRQIKLKLGIEVASPKKATPKASTPKPATPKAAVPKEKKEATGEEAATPDSALKKTAGGRVTKAKKAGSAAKKAVAAPAVPDIEDAEYIVQMAAQHPYRVPGAARGRAANTPTKGAAKTPTKASGKASTKAAAEAEESATEAGEVSDEANNGKFSHDFVEEEGI